MLIIHDRLLSEARVMEKTSSTLVEHFSPFRGGTRNHDVVCMVVVLQVTMFGGGWQPRVRLLICTGGGMPWQRL